MLFGLITKDRRIRGMHISFDYSYTLFRVQIKKLGKNSEGRKKSYDQQKEMQSGTGIWR
jgi:hypothetical protein